MSDECRWCGVAHPKTICPRVKAIEYQDDGVTVKRVEYFAPVDYRQWSPLPQLPFWASPTQPMPWSPLAVAVAYGGDYHN
jgi:hypothetical protein